MKKTLITLIAILFICGVSHRTEAQVRFGAGIAHGNEAEAIGLLGNVLVELNGDLAFQPSLILYLADNSVTYWELNLDGHYYFAGTSSLNAYALAGINFTHIGADFITPFTGEVVRVVDEFIGLNLGVGVNFLTQGNISPFAELKYTINELGQLVGSIGVRF